MFRVMSTQKQKEFLKLYKPIHHNFERFCRARAYGEMEYRDLINDTLLVAYQKFNMLDSEKAFLSFLFSISIRILANNRKKNHEVTGLEGREKVSDENNESKADIYLLYEALSKLPIDQKECIILFEISGFSIKEIAALSEASESAIKKRLTRGREGLKQLLFPAGTKTTVT